ncbi:MULTISPECIES: TolC family protein [Acinetobacter]|uniref:TolC family protein n=1 Tax=Acinetobacter baumannii TaxID=470 RepID=A0AA90HRY0_ACIBA|nr:MULTISPECIES: TolC family protein [Acinetobacter]MEC5498607.1 TolC family protein [Acinetobacter baumannii]MEC6003449.1 TolC family protein [Acinetobacter pittii]MEC6038857.1 TolC family protein [Acinetobacter nosocomialis]MEC6127926.1 TolC family protein [Acinetobacter ursingii]HAV6000100.1 hypothetical protein [Acinetobacter baumannii]
MVTSGANIQVANANLFPSISLTGKADFASADLFDKGIWNLGSRIDMSLLNYGTCKKNLEISKIDYDITLAQYENPYRPHLKK